MNGGISMEQLEQYVLLIWLAGVTFYVVVVVGILWVVCLLNLILEELRYGVDARAEGFTVANYKFYLALRNSGTPDAAEKAEKFKADHQTRTG